MILAITCQRFGEFQEKCVYFTNLLPGTDSSANSNTGEGNLDERLIETNYTTNISYCMYLRCNWFCNRHSTVLAGFTQNNYPCFLCCISGNRESIQCQWSNPQWLELPHLPLVPHVQVVELGQHWFRYWLVASTAPSHYLNQCCLIVNRTLRNKRQWNPIRNTKCFHSWQYIWKCRLRDGGHFVHGWWVKSTTNKPQQNTA